MTRQAVDEDPGTMRWGDGEQPDRALTAGRWALSLRGAELADICYAGRPVLRAIRFIVRDHDWRTADNLIMAAQADRPERVRLTVRSVLDGRPVLDWDAELESGSAMTFTVRGRALRDFRRNRIGLIVLHSPDLAGVPLQIRHGDGADESSQFPAAIAPHQPARDVAGYRWRSDDVDCELSLTGDLFEMEDQRNWTDASYKTYSTPLDRPFPVPVAAGEVIEQSLRLDCRSPHPAPVAQQRSELIMPSADRLPGLQLGASTAPDLSPDPGGTAMSIMVEVPADEEEIWPAVLARADRDAAGGDLDVRIIATDPAQIAPVIAALDGRPVCRIAVYDRTCSRTTTALMVALRDAVRARLSEVPLVAGTRAHFTELNRTIDRFADHDGGLTFSITPQMHDQSRAQVIESLPIQRLVAEQAVRLAAGRPLHIGPVTLRSRFNAVASTPFVPDHRRADLTEGYGAQQVPEATDPRQAAPGLAAWTVCSVAALTVPGVSTLTLFESWGPRGVRAGPRAALAPAGRVLDWIRTAGALVQPPAIEIVHGPTAPIGVLSQRSDRDRQLLIGNPGDRRAVLRVTATTAEVQQSIGGDAAVTPGVGAFVITIPPAGTVKIILDR